LRTALPEWDPYCRRPSPSPSPSLSHGWQPQTSKEISFLCRLWLLRLWWFSNKTHFSPASGTSIQNLNEFHTSIAICGYSSKVQGPDPTHGSLH
jgi:hypothetical protein